MNSKYLQFGLLLLLCVLLDQWTKDVASRRLATTHAWIEHPLTVIVPADAPAGTTVEQVLAAEFLRNDATEVREIARRYVYADDGTKLRPETEVAAGEELRVRYRKVAVVPGYFEFEYTRNPGAAFGILADKDSPWRMPFFVVVSLVAIGVILTMLRGVDPRDRLTIASLGLIAGGAIGNFIDRVSYGWVIDFIVWKYDQYRWPTFNIADVCITVGVALLMLQMVRDSVAERGALVPAPSEQE